MSCVDFQPPFSLRIRMGGAPLLYPFFLALGHVWIASWKGFWRSFLAILLITTTAYALAAVVYQLRTEGLHIPEFGGVLLGIHFIGPLVSAVVWFPIGYFASW